MFRSRLVFVCSVGVTGHRVPPKLPAKSEAPLRTRVDRILTTIVETAHSPDNRFPWQRSDPRPGKFALVSSLAEGSDRLVAEVGLAAGYALEAVLPLTRAEYARDFATPESRAAFERLLGNASSVFELNGAGDERMRAYQAAGFTMLSNVDLLIAIWDGQEAAGVGGTAQIISRAIADGIPVIRLDPQRPDEMQLSWPQPGDLPPAHPYNQQWHTFRSADEATLALVVQDILAVPDEVATRLPQYLSEKERRWNFCLWYPLLLLIFAVRWPSLADFRLPTADTRAQWQKFFSLLPQDKAQRPALENILLPAYSAADHLGIFYSLVYRSTYVFNFFFAALAVALALCGVLVPPGVKIYLVSAELAIIFAILVSWYIGQRRQWHRRWLEYRRLAECLRHMRILAPLGAEGPISRPSLDFDGQDWISWYAWSLRRLIPLPDRVVDRPYLKAICRAVRFVEIADQAAYHVENARRLAMLDRRMHHVGQILFATTGAVCAVFVVLFCLHALPAADDPHHDLVLGLFTFLTALLPTFGAALGAIHAQGDFKTRSEQSRRTASRLDAINQKSRRGAVGFCSARRTACRKPLIS